MNTALTFCYQLQGYAEIANTDPVKEQWLVILEKLAEISIEDLIIETDCFMQHEVFIVWLKGYVDVVKPMNITSTQWQIIKDHLQLVFTKVTPSYEDEDDDSEVAQRVKKAFETLVPGQPSFTIKPEDVACSHQPMSLAHGDLKKLC